MRIILILTLLISIQSFGQVPTGYQVRRVNERLQGKFMIDTSVTLPRYADTTAANLHKGVDTCGAVFFAYLTNSLWIRACNPKHWVEVGSSGVTENIFTSDGILEGDRTVTGNEDTYYLLFDSVNAFIVSRAGVDRIYMNNLGTLIKSPDESQYFGTENDSSYVIADANNMIWKSDSTLSKKKISYYSNIRSTFNQYTLVDKGYVDSVAIGTINSGTTGKPAYYVGATTLDDFIAVDYATSGTHAKVTAQVATDIPITVTGAGSQSANLQVWENSSNTDLTYIEADGDLVMTATSGKQITGTGTEIIVRQTGDAFGESGFKVRNRTGSAGGLFYNASLDVVDIGLLSSSTVQYNVRYDHRGTEIISGNTNGEFQFFRSTQSTPFFRVGEAYGAYYGSFIFGGANEEVPGANLHVEGAEGVDATFLLDADDGDDNPDSWFIKSIAADNELTFTNHTTLIASLISTGGLRMPEIAAPSTPASATSVIYPKSDGLWYGKDDAGAESRLSNLIMSKGLTLESPGSAEDFGMWKTQVAITVSSINAVVKGSSPSVTINIAFGSDITSLTNVFSAGTAITNTTTGQTVNSGFNDATIPAGSWIRLISTASSGTITQIEVTINYTED